MKPPENETPIERCGRLGRRVADLEEDLKKALSEKSEKELTVTNLQSEVSRLKDKCNELITENMDLSRRISGSVGMF